jgi:hypothetical protein
LSAAKELRKCAERYLKVIVPEWLAGTLRIEEGSVVRIDNQDGKFNISPVNPQPIQ